MQGIFYLLCFFAHLLKGSMVKIIAQEPRSKSYLLVEQIFSLDNHIP